MNGPSPPAVRVLLVINRLTELGGAEGSTALIVDGLAGRGVEFVVVTLHDLDLTSRDRLEARGVRFVESGPGFPAQLRCVLREIRRQRPDIIHSTLFDADVVACIAGLLAGVPVVRSIVSTQYGSEAAGAARSRARLEVARLVDRALARYATFRFHAISRAAADAAERALGIVDDHVVLVPRGRDLAALGERTPERCRRVRAELDLADDVPVLINVARHDAQKGQVLLLEAFARVVTGHPNAVLLVAGREGPCTPDLRAAIDRLGLGARVRLLGVRSDVADLLCAADVFVFSSLWEGLGGAVLEAMAMEVPVVTFDVPAVAEALDGTGVLVPIRDTAALATAIDALLADPDRRNDLARRARRSFDARFTITVYLEGMKDLYVAVANAAHSEYHDPLRPLRRRSGRSTRGR